MQVNAIPAFDDNYIWLITEKNSQFCAVVDPGDEEPVLAELSSKNLQLAAILITHKHYDHVGGVKALKQQFPNAKVYGPGNEGIVTIEQTLNDGDTVALPEMGLVFSVLSVPGHTEGHIAYHGHDSVFCGDTLFAGGCGRVFTGTFEQLSDSLEKISRLPAKTKVYCAHEYTLANLGFAAWVEPDNKALKQRYDRVKFERENNQSTVPSMLAEELETNPFMRTDQKAVRRAAENWANTRLESRASVFKALRQWKDRDYD